MKFPPDIRVPLTNHHTGQTYHLVRASDVPTGAEALARIAAICNEPEIYEWLFRGRLSGQAYTPDMARHFLQWAGEGWAAGTHFVFTVVDRDGAVAAACDIKTNTRIAEIGYWSSRNHRGVMTNAVRGLITLATEAGFVGLFARTKPGNTRSEAVLARAGFVKVRSDPDDFIRHELSLQANQDEPQRLPAHERAGRNVH